MFASASLQRTVDHQPLSPDVRWWKVAHIHFDALDLAIFDFLDHAKFDALAPVKIYQIRLREHPSSAAPNSTTPCSGLVGCWPSGWTPQIPRDHEPPCKK